MRIHVPIPIVLNFLPILIIIFSQYFISMKNNTSAEIPLWTLIWISIVGSFLTRSLGCIINDFFDKDFDKKTSRTKNRPLALDDSDKSKPSNLGIGILVLILTTISLSLAIILGKIPTIISILTGSLIVLYPLTKRFFILPQLFLGFVYNMGIIVICSAVSGWLNFQCFLFFVINILWTLAYDTVYAGQDEIDDRKNSLKSSVLTFGPEWKKIVEKIYNIVFALLIIFQIAIGGTFAIISTILSFIFIKYQYSKMIKKNSFQKFFEYNALIFLFLLSGIVIDTLVLFYQK